MPRVQSPSSQDAQASRTAGGQYPGQTNERRNGFVRRTKHSGSHGTDRWPAAWWLILSGVSGVADK